jgi:hypothetical protein
MEALNMLNGNNNYKFAFGTEKGVRSNVQHSNDVRWRCWTHSRRIAGSNDNRCNNCSHLCDTALFASYIRFANYLATSESQRVALTNV